MWMTMIKLTILFLVILCFTSRCWSVEFRQERATINFVNPKYVANLSVITRRVSRHEPYRTNLTFTTLMTYGNNVSFAFILRLKNGGDFKVQAKVCDTMRTKWMHKYMAQYTNIPLDNCPIPPGTYYYRNMELPPKNVPIPVLDGDYHNIMELFITATKEIVFSGGILLHFDERAASRGDNKNGDKKNKKNKDKKG